MVSLREEKHQHKPESPEQDPLIEEDSTNFATFVAPAP
jgi:hypothetical protein